MQLAHTTLVLTLLAPASAFVAFSQAAQTAPQSASTARLLGTVTAVSGNTITLKSDKGVVSTVTVSDTTRIVRTEPGQKDLSSATAIHLQDLAVGDRVLVRATPGEAENTYAAQAVIAMKQSDIAQKQQQDREDWQRRGAGGLVKSADAASGTIVVTSGSRTITIHTSPKTIVRRYAQDSVKFDDAKASSLDQIKPGDQLRARGERNADGTEITADEIVAGTFRNIAATVASVDAGAQTATVNDLVTKRPVTIHFTSDSQMRKLAPETAQMIAARLKGGAVPQQGQGMMQRPVSASGPAGPGGPQGQRGGDMQQVLQRAPSVQISDLHKGDAVMIVATEGSADSATAITLLAGVEPMLQASTKGSQSLFSSSWSLGGGDAAAAAQQ